MHPCPCCGYPTLAEARRWEICEVCFWEDDPLGPRRPNIPLASNNGISLSAARDNYARLGVCDPGMAGLVRPPTPEERAGRIDVTTIIV